MTTFSSHVTLTMALFFVSMFRRPGCNMGVNQANAGAILEENSPRVAQFASREVYQGQSVELTCTVAGSGSLSVCWHVASDHAASTASRYISYCADPERSTDDDGRHRVITDRKRGVYNLRINPVIQADSGLYMCAILNPAGIAVLFGSGRMSVRTPLAPSAGPTCQFSIRNPVLKEGEMASTTCFAASDGEPMPSLQWVNEDDGAYPLSQVTVAKANQISWQVSARDEGAVYTCVERHIALETPRNCTIGPLQVAYRPILTLDTNLPRPKIGQNVTISCTARGNPPPSRMSWYVDDIAIQNIDKLEYRIDTFQKGAKMNVSRLTLIRFREELYNATITFSADNSQGSRNVSIMITLPPKQPPADGGGKPYDHLRVILVVDLVALAAIVFFSVCVLGCWNSWRNLSARIREACSRPSSGKPIHIPL